MAVSARQVRIPVATLASLVLALLLFAGVGVGQAQATSNAYTLQSSFPGGVCTGTHNSGQRDGLGNVYVPCGNPSTVRVFDPKGNLTKTIPLGFYATDVAPSWDGQVLYAAQYRLPSAPGADDGGAVAIRRLTKDAETGNYVVNETDWSLKTYTKNGGTYKAKGGKIATDSKGHLYVSDGAGGNTNVQGDEVSTIVKHDAAGNVVTHFGGTAKNGAGGPFYGLLGGIAVSEDGNRVYAVEGNNPAGAAGNKGNHLFRFDKQTGSEAYVQQRKWGADTVAGSECTYRGEIGEAFATWVPSYFAAPWDIELDADENLYVVNASCREALKFDSNFNFQVGMKIGGATAEPHNQGKPHGIAVSAAGEVYVGEANAKLDLDGEAVRPTSTVAPASGAEGVGVNSNVTATFSEAMMPGGMSFVLKNAAGTTVASAASYDKATKTATLNPNADLAADATYTATLTGAKDLWGNLADPNPKTWTFKTAGGVVTPAPTVSITSGPLAGSSDPDTTPTFGFSSNQAGTFQCRFDAESYQNCSSPHERVNPLSTDQQHTFYVKVTNANGTDEESRTWTVSSTPPPGRCRGEANTTTGSDDPNAPDNLSGRAGVKDVIGARSGADTIGNLDNTDVACGGVGLDTFKRFSGTVLIDGAGDGAADDTSDVVDFSWITQEDVDDNGRGAYVALGGISDGKGFEVTSFNVADAVGSSFPDSMYGDNMRNTIKGGAGSDTIVGGAEAAGANGDNIDGEAGDDTIRVRDGSRDTVYCGENADDFDTVEADELDVIMDDPNAAGSDCEQVDRSDTADPVITPISPRPGATIRDRTPTIRATVSDDVTDLAKGDVQLYVRGTLIPGANYSYDPGDDALVYQSTRLPASPAGKKTTVKVVATDAADNEGMRAWSFTIRRR